MIILGAGLAGAIANGRFSQLAPSIFDAGRDKGCLDNHKAIMRIRDPRTALLLGCDVREVEVTKQVWFQQKLHNDATIQMNNLYSLRVSNEIHKKSISTLGTQKRYIIQGQIRPSNVKYEHNLVKVEPGVLYFETPHGEYCVEYDKCISTIPLPVLLEAAYSNYFTKVQFNLFPIQVYRANLKIPCTTNQTIYFPEKRYAFYRATLQEGTIIAESRDTGSITRWEVGQMLKVFGLDESMVIDEKATIQKNGKMNSIDDNERKALIYRLTDDFGIYSLGRFAIWKPIRVDHLVGDVEKIARMMAVDSTLLNGITRKERASGCSTD